MIFGIDFGLKRIGLAKLVENIIMPLPAILRKNRNQASQDFKATILANLNSQDFNKAILVFGIPMPNHETNLILSQNHLLQKHTSIPPTDSHDNDTEMQRRIKHFLSLIDFSGQIFFIDESFSSKEAQERLLDRGYEIRQKARKNGVLDSLSACVILERFMKAQESKFDKTL